MGRFLFFAKRVVSVLERIENEEGRRVEREEGSVGLGVGEDVKKEPEDRLRLLKHGPST